MSYSAQPSSDSSPLPFDPSSGHQYQDVVAKDIAYVEVFPAVGIARVGTSGFDLRDGKRSVTNPVEYFIGPEMPQPTYGPNGGYRDKEQAIKRQGARFRVYAYDATGKNLGEVNAANGYTLKWTIDVANMKSASTIFNGRLTNPQRTELRNPDIQPDLPHFERTKLVIKPKAPIVISGTKLTAPVIGKFQGSRKAEEAVEVDLGEAKTDDCGRLIFVGGSGWSACVTKDTGYRPDEEYPHQPEVVSEFDGVDWFDSTCDGRIKVEISKGTSTWTSRHDAWVLSGPPDFARDISAPTSLWDIMEDMYNKNSPTFYADPTVQFYRDIWPVLNCTYMISWTNKDALQGHGPNGKGNFLELEKDLQDPEQHALRGHVFGRIRTPDYLNPDQASIKWMPRLSGDGGDAIEAGDIQTRDYNNPISKFASLTTLQYERFKRWAQGDFSATPYPSNTDKAVQKLEDLPVAEQPEYLTRAALSTTIGDPLYPGIETYWIVKTRDVYDFTVDSTVKPPFRIKSTLHPGDMTKGLSLPWQSDFNLCATHWWPSARPDDVLSEHDFLRLLPQIVNDNKPFASALDSAPRRNWVYPMRDSTGGSFYPGSTDMVRLWSYLGFVTRLDIPNQPPVYVEVQRLLPTELPGEQRELVAASDEEVKKALGERREWKLNEKGRLVPV